MNTLSYGLLSILSQASFSGYDLMLRTQPFWPAKHSQIYPLLANLEKEEYVSYEHVCQSDKPDKKVYSLTEKGKEALRGWLTEPAADPVTRDELMLKTYCLSYTDPEGAKRLFAARLDYYHTRLRKHENTVESLRRRGDFPANGEAPPFDSLRFGAYVLMEKALRTTRSNIEWTEWAMRLLESQRK
ncbi:PadR family transcriptional regulator [Cohnella sp. GCM10027633]|uniref:PadR family transcriptional regulator n=1 Tax=unclassified Cohnella TaxID=2636738 RepID=UPI0036445155